MPIYDFKCVICGTVAEDKYVRHEGDKPICCNAEMFRLPSTIAMVKWKGSGGYPSNMKLGKGTAPFTGNYKKPGTCEKSEKYVEQDRQIQKLLSQS